MVAVAGARGRVRPAAHAPTTAASAMPRRTAGVLIPLFSLRTRGDFGRGEIRALVPMADFALAMGHRVIQLLPVDETAPGETSPYSAMSVMAIDPLYVSTRGLAGVGPAAIERARAQAGPGDPPDPIRLHAAMRELLHTSYRYFRTRGPAAERDALAAFVHDNREWLPDYALFRALKDRFQWAPWRSWPDGLSSREPAAIAAAARDLADEVATWSYVQFIAHRQWREVRAQLADRGVLLGGDLAFSPGCESAEVWSHQAMFDLDRSVGAPPDAFSATGQRWGLPMPNWERMRASGFALIRMRIRHARALYDLLRIDHLVGLFRTYGFGAELDAPGAFDPAAESDQLAQGEEILRIAQGEAAAMELIAEDLGVIPPFVRRSLKTLGLPGYKVMRWEREWNEPRQPFIDPVHYAELSVATTGTHDTETLCEWWREAQAGERLEFVRSLRLEGKIDPLAAVLDAGALDAALDSLYGAGSRLTIVPVQDIFGWDARINTPGTVNDANWKWRLPFSLEGPADDPGRAARIAAIRDLAIRHRRF